MSINVEKPKFYGKYINTPYYRDYRYLCDDSQVLRNPHKGWYWHFIDNGVKVMNYRENVEGDYLEDFKGVNHLYLRFDWSDIEAEEGVFDWSYIDKIIDEYAPHGFTFTMRVCTFEGSKIMPYSTPEWVKNAGAKGQISVEGSWLPDYTDPIFNQKLESFMAEYGRKYNNHPAVEYVDVGTYGIWGEGHCDILGEGKSGFETHPVEVLKKHIDLHLKYFPDKYVIVNDDMINALKDKDSEGSRYLTDYCVGKGMGLRDDSILCACYADTGYYGYDTIRTPFMFDEFYENAPIDIELEHMRHWLNDPTHFKEGYPIYETLRRTHATYCGFHGYPRDMLNKYPYFADRIANKLGYWYFLNAAEIPECVTGFNSVMTLWFENKGFCHAYNSFKTAIKLISNETNKEYTVAENDGMNLSWKAESITKEKLKLSFRNVPAGEYAICIGMFEGERPIKLGFKKQCLMNDGFYKFDSISVKPQ